jgi:hypothetical protein
MGKKDKEYFIITTTPEGFNKVENAYKLFKKSYSLSKGDSPLLLSEVNDKKGIGIYPLLKTGEINGVIKKKSNIEGVVIRTESDGWMVKLKDNHYYINKKSMEF